MYRSFEFDYKGMVAAALTYDPSTYINDRVQVLYGTRYGDIINKTSELVIEELSPKDDRFYSLVYFAGAALTLEALEYSDLTECNSKYLKRCILTRGEPRYLKDTDSDTSKDIIQRTSLVGHTTHPELQDITDRISEYYSQITKNAEETVSLAVGLMAFELDQCVSVLRKNNPIFDMTVTLEETDWNNIAPSDIIGDLR